MTGEVRNGKYFSDEDVRRETDELNARAAKAGEIDKGRECMWHTPKILREMLQGVEKRVDVDKDCLRCSGYDFKCKTYEPKKRQPCLLRGAISENPDHDCSSCNGYDSCWINPLDNSLGLVRRQS